MSEQPIVDEWLDERLGLFDLIDIAGRGERCKLRQDRNPSVDAANRVTPLTKRRDILVNLRPEPATHDPIDSLRLDEKAFQHGNLHSKVGNRRMRFCCCHKEMCRL